MVRLAGQVSPLLRRPFSIHDLILEENRVTSFDILYKIIGSGTEALSMSSAGDVLDVLGPLGRGFSTRGTFSQVHMVARPVRPDEPSQTARALHPDTPGHRRYACESTPGKSPDSIKSVSPTSVFPLGTLSFPFL